MLPPELPPVPAYPTYLSLDRVDMENIVILPNAPEFPAEPVAVERVTPPSDELGEDLAVQAAVLEAGPAGPGPEPPDPRPRRRGKRGYVSIVLLAALAAIMVLIVTLAYHSGHIPPIGEWFGGQPEAERRNSQSAGAGSTNTARHGTVPGARDDPEHQGETPGIDVVTETETPAPKELEIATAKLARDTTQLGFAQIDCYAVAERESAKDRYKTKLKNFSWMDGADADLGRAKELWPALIDNFKKCLRTKKRLVATSAKAAEGVLAVRRAQKDKKGKVIGWKLDRAATKKEGNDTYVQQDPYYYVSTFPCRHYDFEFKDKTFTKEKYIMIGPCLKHNGAGEYYWEIKLGKTNDFSNKKNKLQYRSKRSYPRGELPIDQCVGNIGISVWRKWTKKQEGENGLGWWYYPDLLISGVTGHWIYKLFSFPKCFKKGGLLGIAGCLCAYRFPQWGLGWIPNMLKGAEVGYFDNDKDCVIKFVCRGSTKVHGKDAAPIDASLYARRNTRSQGCCFQLWTLLKRLLCFSGCCTSTPEGYKDYDTRISNPDSYDSKEEEDPNNRSYDININGIDGGFGGGRPGNFNNYVVNGGGGCCWPFRGGGATKYELDVKTNKDTDPEYRALRKERDRLEDERDAATKAKKKAKEDMESATKARDSAEGKLEEARNRGFWAVCCGDPWEAFRNEMKGNPAVFLVALMVFQQFCSWGGFGWLASAGVWACGLLARCFSALRVWV